MANPELLRVARVPLFHVFRPPSAASASASASASSEAIRRASSPREALHLFKLRVRRSQQLDVDFDSHAAVFALKSCSRPPFDLLLPHIHGFILKRNLSSHVFVASALLHVYSLTSPSCARALFDEIPHRNIVTENTMLACLYRAGDLSAARTVFNGMAQKDIVTWSTMIGAYMDMGQRAISFALFRDMMNDTDLKPDPLMFVTLLTCCSRTGSLHLMGRSIHAYAEKNGLEINVQLGTSLIDMYAKSGFLKTAYNVFERIPEKNVMHWTAMICGLAMHGHGREAVAFFEKMQETGLSEITATGAHDLSSNIDSYCAVQQTESSCAIAAQLLGNIDIIVHNKEEHVA
ncbi:hypothetical protein Cni_G13674 [Canna indica]|uniref:Pentatricopeptide repeat-containing protein n=1 Tax=Canna indica TaxID=4628 RepID=A0AAQ3QCX5_9LILI|nr:hypothetical protein Cni_G13674 [Canna indica]